VLQADKFIHHVAFCSSQVAFFFPTKGMSERQEGQCKPTTTDGADEWGSGEVAHGGGWQSSTLVHAESVKRFKVPSVPVSSLQSETRQELFTLPVLDREQGEPQLTFFLQPTVLYRFTTDFKDH
jgi:hypothetical protein